MSIYGAYTYTTVREDTGIRLNGRRLRWLSLLSVPATLLSRTASAQTRSFRCDYEDVLLHACPPHDTPAALLAPSAQAELQQQDCHIKPLKTVSSLRHSEVGHRGFAVARPAVNHFATHAVAATMQLLASLVLAASATTSNGLAAPALANPGATNDQGGLFAAVAAKNAEMLAVKEGRSRRKAHQGRQESLPAAPFSMMTEKGPTLAKLLERRGCVGVPEALTPETAATLRAFVEDRRARPWPRSKRAARPSSRASAA